MPLEEKRQTEEMIERVKVLGEDSAAKVVEAERLRREEEGLRLLLPHYTGCGDEKVVACLNGLCNVGVGCGVVGTGTGIGTVVGQDD